MPGVSDVPCSREVGLLVGGSGKGFVACGRCGAEVLGPLLALDISSVLA